MSSPKKSRLPGALRWAIDRYRRRWRAVHAETGLLVTLGVLAATVGAAVAADRLLRLSPVLRTVALAAIAAASLFCLTRWVLWPALRRLGDRDAAVGLGRQDPKVEEDLVSAVELSKEGAEEPGVSPGLIRSALTKIVERTRGVDYRRAVPLRPLAKSGAVLLIVAGLLAAAYALRPEAIQNALVRLVRPSEKFFCYTQLEIEPGDRVIRTGDAVEIAIATSRRPAEVARLYGRRGDGQDEADRLFVRLDCEDGAARWDSGPLFEDLAYRVRAGDAVSQWHRIRVVPPPALASKGAVLTAPDYAGSRQETIEELAGPLEVVKGTTVTIRAVPVDRGSAPELRCTGEMANGDQRIPLRPEPSGVLVSEPFLPEEDAEYRITLSDGFGLQSRTPGRLFIKVAPDRVPVVNIPEPGRDLWVLPGERVPVRVEARDEFGLRGLVLRRRIHRAEDEGGTTGRWQDEELREGGPDVTEAAAERTLAVGELGLSAGDVLEYTARASDYADEALLRRGYSPRYRVTVMSEMEHLERVLGKLRDMGLELRRRAAVQKAQSARAGGLAEKAEEGDGQAAKAGAAEAQQRELEEARGTEHLARRLERLLPELTRNPSTPTRMLSEMERLGRSVRSVARQPMGRAAQQFGRAAQGQQGQQGRQSQQGQSGQAGQQGQQGQPLPLRIAQEATEQASRRLQQLARMAERLQRRSILEKLADQAEALATRQREIKDNLVPLAVDTAGADVKDLTEEQQETLRRLVGLQRSIEQGVEELAQGIEKASSTLAFSHPNDAATAVRAREELEDQEVGPRAAKITSRLESNVLFSQLPEQEGVARSLEKVAEILRKGVPSEEMEAIAKELDEFIRRQRALNGDIQAAIEETEKARRPNQLGGDQSALQRDVAEQASALHWLAREIEMFRSETADKLDAAAREMGLGTTALFAKDLPEGLDRGEKALALLEDARERFQSERQQMQQAELSARMIQAMLLFQRIFLGQKRVNTGTVKADPLRLRQDERFSERAVALAKKQSKVRVDAAKLKELLERSPAAAALVEKAREKMNVSRIALGAGDTGPETRKVQRMILALLEKLIGQPGMGAAGLAGLRARTMMQMMAGASGGGFTGGTNAPLLPATLDEAKDESWRKVRSRFEEELGTAFEARVPPRYRGLINAYFNRLRQAPPE